MKDSNILAYQTRLSAIFTSADKSCLTYTYPTRGIDKNRITTRVANTLVAYYVVKTLEVDIIVTSYTTSTFNMADVNV